MAQYAQTGNRTNEIEITRKFLRFIPVINEIASVVNTAITNTRKR